MKQEEGGTGRKDEAKKTDEEGNGGEETSKHCGTLIVDATCAPADIQFPTDVRNQENLI